MNQMNTFIQRRNEAALRVQKSQPQKGNFSTEKSKKKDIYEDKNNNKQETQDITVETVSDDSSVVTMFDETKYEPKPHVEIHLPKVEATATSVITNIETVHNETTTKDIKKKREQNSNKYDTNSHVQTNVNETAPGNPKDSTVLETATIVSTVTSESTKEESQQNVQKTTHQPHSHTKNKKPQNATNSENRFTVLSFDDDDETEEQKCTKNQINTNLVNSNVNTEHNNPTTKEINQKDKIPPSKVKKIQVQAEFANSNSTQSCLRNGKNTTIGKTQNDDFVMRVYSEMRDILLNSDNENHGTPETSTLKQVLSLNELNPGQKRPLLPNDIDSTTNYSTIEEDGWTKVKKKPSKKEKVKPIIETVTIPMKMKENRPTTPKSTNTTANYISTEVENRNKVKLKPLEKDKAKPPSKKKTIKTKQKYKKTNLKPKLQYDRNSHEYIALQENMLRCLDQLIQNVSEASKFVANYGYYEVQQEFKEQIKRYRKFNINIHTSPNLMALNTISKEIDQDDKKFHDTYTEVCTELGFDLNCL